MKQITLPLLPKGVRWLGVTLIAGIIFYFSVITVPTTPMVPKPDLIPLDKWRHFLAYLGMAWSLAYATIDLNYKNRTLAVIVLFITFSYGVGIEVAQSLLPYRYFSIGDVIANVFGGMLVIPWYIIVKYIRFKSVSV